jgi:hypothetical protein
MRSLMLLCPAAVVVEITVKSNSLTEAALIDHLSPSASMLPPLWSVIYEEAVRGNHVLFDASDIEAFQKDPTPHYDDAEIAWVVTYIAQQTVKTSLIELQRAVRELPEVKRGLVFILYMNAIQYFTAQLKRSLN